MAMLEIKLNIQDLRIDDVENIVRAIRICGGTANGKATEINLESGDITKELFVVNNELASKLFTDEGANDGSIDPIPSQASGTVGLDVGCANSCSGCDCNSDIK